MMSIWRLLVALLCIAVSGTSAAEVALPRYMPAYEARVDVAPVYVFGVHPLYNPVRMLERFGPLVDYLNTNIPGVRFRLEASRDYADFEHKLASRKLHFALPNPYQTLQSLRSGYHVFAKMGDDEEFRGLILVRRDSGIRSLADLKGKVVSYPAPTALAATLLPQYFLFTQGMDVQRDFKNLYVGSQQSSIMAVYSGFAAAGATWPLPWMQFQQEYPEKASALAVRWYTQTLPNNGLVARDDVPPALRERVKELLTNLHRHAAGQAQLEALSLSHFESANDATYEPVRTFVRNFERYVRPIQEPVAHAND